MKSNILSDRQSRLVSTVGHERLARFNPMLASIAQCPEPTYYDGQAQGIRYEDGGLVVPSGSWTDTQSALAFYRARKISPAKAADLYCVRAPLALRSLQQTRQALKQEARSVSARQRAMGKDITPDLFKWDRAVGIELECFGPSVAKWLPISCRETSDGSLQWHSLSREGMPEGSAPREYRILCRRSDFEVRVHRVCKLLSRHRVNKSCGFHVHMDMRGRTEEQVTKLARRLDLWMSALVELQPQSRRENSYCKPGVSARDRYRRVNVCSFPKHQTLEIRFAAGTVDPEKIIAWVRLLELLVAVAKAPNKSLCSGDRCMDALASLPLCEYERGFWIARHRTLNPQQYTGAGAASNDEGEGR